MHDDLHEHVDGDRLRDDILATAEFGNLPNEDGHGRTVLAGTEPNRRAREHFVERARDADLDVRIDGVGNVVGRWDPGGVAPNTPAVAAGSHLDSVTAGGMFDGVLGVYAALEAVRAMQAAGATPDRPLEVVSFTEEEGGRFSDGVLGSSVATGDRSIESALALRDADGVALGEALDRIGFRGEGRLDATAWDSWLELHVEQGTRLETAGVPAGIVTHITGTIRCHVNVIGEANHAGTTSMADRTDALTAASELALEIESTTRDINARSETAVATVGQFDVAPDAINVIPGEVTLGIDIRDIDYGTMEDIVSSIRDCLTRLEVERGVETTFERPYDIEPVSMSERCKTTLRDAAAGMGFDTCDLHSGAGHDTMNIATVTDSGMLFAPSRGGHSHSPAEWTAWSDCAAATRLLTRGLHELATD